MSTSPGERLTAVHSHPFVGRTAELALFQRALDVNDPSFQVLFIHGPGGVGKTTLLAEFALRCAAANIPTYCLDARNIDPTPESFIAALRAALILPDDKSLLHTLAEQPSVHVFFIDTTELLLPIDDWLCEVCLPQLPENARVIMAGREPPSAAWQAVAGWQTSVRERPLRNFTPDEAHSYLSQCGIPEQHHASIMHCTYGCPLALALIAESFAQGSTTFEFPPADQPESVAALLECFAQSVSDSERAALEASALVRVTTEDLLSEMLHDEAVSDLFDWLRGLSFVEDRSDGLFPHDLARAALVAELRRRNPAWYAELLRRARGYYHRRIEATTDQLQQRLLLDLIFLQRDRSEVRPFWEWQSAGAVLEAMRSTDAPLLEQLIDRYEGTESARIAAYWFTQQPQAAHVLRAAGGQPTGLLVMLKLNLVTAADLQIDPAMQAAWTYLQRKPLHVGETATLFRFWLARDTYQAVSPIQSAIFVNVARHCLTTPDLAFAFFPCADPDFWLPMFTAADLIRIPEADFVVGGKSFGVYGRDWRSEPPAAWLKILVEE